MFGKEDMFRPVPSACDGGVGRIVSSFLLLNSTRDLPDGRMAKGRKELTRGSKDSDKSQLRNVIQQHVVCSTRSEEILGAVLFLQAELRSRERNDLIS